MHVPYRIVAAAGVLSLCGLSAPPADASPEGSYSVMVGAPLVSVTYTEVILAHCDPSTIAALNGFDARYVEASSRAGGWVTISWSSAVAVPGASLGVSFVGADCTSFYDPANGDTHVRLGDARTFHVAPGTKWIELQPLEGAQIMVNVA